FDEVEQDPRNFTNGLYDLQSVQVLKGPQGTLFGKNSDAGAVLFVPNRPKNIFEASAQLRLGNYNDRQVTGMVNIPVTDQLFLRASGTWQKRDGWQKSVTGGPDYDDRNNYSLRLQGTYRPTDSFENYTQVNYSLTDQHS